MVISRTGSAGEREQDRRGGEDAGGSLHIVSPVFRAGWLRNAAARMDVPPPRVDIHDPKALHMKGNRNWQ
ncbi:hypothetical protein GCM10017612_11590 [Novosphingobium resinovorum]|nr:hypothetical protein GCM10017612_11590 [Novosphingobium resinovorum]